MWSDNLIDGFFMRWIFIFCLGFLGIVILWFLVHQNNGTVIFLMPPYRVEVAATLAICGVLFFFMILNVSLKVCFLLFNLPTILKKNRTKKKMETAMNGFVQSVKYWMQGSHEKSLSELKKVLKNGYAKEVTQAFAFLLSDKLGRAEERDRYIKDLREAFPEEAALIGFIEAKSAFDKNNFECVLRILADGRSLKEKPSSELRLLLIANKQTENFKEAFDMAEILVRRGDLDFSKRDEIVLLKAQKELVLRAGKVDELKKYWEKIPKKAKSSKEAVLIVLHHLLKSEEYTYAKKLVESSLDEIWDAEVLMHYPVCCSNSFKSGLERCERWLINNPEDPDLLRILGELCIMGRIWGKAGSYLKKSSDIKRNPLTCWQLAKLYEKTNRKELAAESYKKGLALVTGQPL